LVSDIPAKDGKVANFFLQCTYSTPEMGRQGSNTTHTKAASTGSKSKHRLTERVRHALHIEYREIHKTTDSRHIKFR
jgi:hypothetical protein